MDELWTDRAWEDYLYWQSQDKKTLKRINELIRDIERSAWDGIGKPEPLKGELSGQWSRRINDLDRLVYRLQGDALVIRHPPVSWALQQLTRRPERHARALDLPP